MRFLLNRTAPQNLLDYLYYNHLPTIYCNLRQVKRNSLFMSYNDRRFTRWISQNVFSQPFGEFCIILRLKIKQFIARYLSVTIAWNELILTCYICLEFDWLKLRADCTIAAFRDSIICKNRCVSSVSLKRSL